MVNISPNKVIELNIISNVKDKETQVQQVGIDLTIKEDVSIEHGSSVNVDFNETFDMKNCFAIFNVRSSFSRKGVFVTSGVYDPGFKGIGGCSIYNMSGCDVIIPKNSRIGQMVVFEADFVTKYSGYYNDAENTKSKLD